MKGLLKIVFALLVSALLTNAQSYSYSYGITTFGDVRLETLNNGTIICDSMICPQEASHCRVTKRTDPTNSQVIVRNTSCLDDNCAVILEKIVNEPNPSNRKVNLVVNSGKFGNSVYNNTELTPEEQRELEEKLRRKQQERDEKLRRRQQERDEKLRRKQQEREEKLRRKQQERDEKLRRKQQERDEKLRRKQQEREEKLRQKQQKIEAQMSEDMEF